MQRALRRVVRSEVLRGWLPTQRAAQVAEGFQIFPEWQASVETQVPGLAQEFDGPRSVSGEFVRQLIGQLTAAFQAANWIELEELGRKALLLAQSEGQKELSLQLQGFLLVLERGGQTDLRERERWIILLDDALDRLNHLAWLKESSR